MSDTVIRGYGGFMEIRNQNGDLIVAEPLHVRNINIHRDEPNYLEDLLGNRMELPSRRTGNVQALLFGNEAQLRQLYPDFSLDQPVQLTGHEITVRLTENAESFNRFHNAILQSLNVLPLEDQPDPQTFAIDASWVYQHEEATLNLPVELRPEAEEYIERFEVYERIGTNLRGIRADVMVMDEFHDLPADEFNIIVGRSRRPSISVEKVNWRQEGF